MEIWPQKEKVDVHLSTDQWNDIIETIDIKNKGVIESARNELDASISKYLWKSFIDQQAISPAARSAIYSEMATLSDALLLTIEKYFFPIDPSNREWWYDAVVRRQNGRSGTQPNELLFEPESNNTATADGNHAQRNEFTRRVLLSDIKETAIVSNGCELEMDLIHGGISLIRTLAKAAHERSRPATGRRGDPRLLQMIADTLKVYIDLGGVGFTTKGEPPPFMERLMKYVIEFARDKLGDEHARNLMHSLQGGQLKEKIKEARKKRDYLY